jgi:dTDP-4-amino-4,6-dideoxygalactose transaminase
MPGALVPVGSRYLHASTPATTALQVLEAAWAPYACELLSSGTAALALALRAARVTRGMDHGDVLLPAYSCPSLVAAAIAANCDAVLIDTAREGWGFDLHALESALSPRAVAVVAIDLFGVGDQAAELEPLCAARGVTLIQDGAQSMPPDAADWRSDLVVLSFGRGKPINLLGGGALLRRPARTAVGVALQAALDAQLSALPVSRSRPLRQGLLGAAYNTLTNPSAYSLARRMPGLHIGATSFEPLEVESRLDRARLGNLAAALDAYRARPVDVQLALTEALPALHAAGFEPLRGSRWPAQAQARLLRFPLLARDAALAARAHLALEARGLGASRMYANPLPQIMGVPQAISRQGPFPQAADLARRLITLPVHHRVTGAHVAAMVDTLSHAARTD